jgi:hypothetical protein
MNKVPSYVEWTNNFTGPQRWNQGLPYHLERFRPDRLKSTTIEKHVGEDEKRPKNLKANVLPSDGYGLEVDGRVKSEYETAEAAAKVD